MIWVNAEIRYHDRVWKIENAKPEIAAQWMSDILIAIKDTNSWDALNIKWNAWEMLSMADKCVNNWCNLYDDCIAVCSFRDLCFPRLDSENKSEENQMSVYRILFSDSRGSHFQDIEADNLAIALWELGKKADIDAVLIDTMYLPSKSNSYNEPTHAYVNPSIDIGE